MNAPRVDLYTVIHKMLRAELFASAQQIANTNFADPESRATLIANIRETMGFIDEHGQHEDQFVDPVLAKCAPDLAASVQSDHEQLHASGEAILALATEIEASEGAGAIALGARLHAMFSLFLAEYLSHMVVEEGPVNQSLWEHHSDEELAMVRGELQGSIPPPRFAQFFVKMVPTMNHQERVGMLTGIKLGAPAPAFEALSGMARDVLGEQGWAEVARELPS
jgi:hypothetical protein